MKNFLFQFNLLPSNTAISKKCFIRKDMNWEIQSLECRKVLSITAYVAGIVRVTLLEKGPSNCMTQFWMEKEVQIKKRWLKLSLCQCSQRQGTWEASVCSSEQMTLQKSDRSYHLNNWNVNFKETEMPPKWGLHSFQLGSSRSHVQCWHLPHLTTSATYTPVTSAG